MSETMAGDIGYDPFDVKVMADPHPYYRRLRNERPIYYTPQYDTFWVSRFKDLVEMQSIRDNALVSSESSIPMPEVLLNHHQGTPPEAPRCPMSPMTLLHSPHYDDIRRAHDAPFKFQSVAELEPFTREVANRLLDEHIPKGSFDLFLDYSGMISALTICKLFGIDDSNAKELLEAVNALTTYDPERGGIDNALFFTKLKRFMVPAIAKRRAEGADGSNSLYDGLIHYHTREDNRPLSDNEIADALTCVFIAGTETPGKVSSQGLMSLANHPQQLAAVRSDLANNCAVATEEMLRMHAPAQWFLRTIFKDIEIGGVTMKAGQRVAGLVASAMRDETEYENPEAFIWNRPITRQLAFGLGLHHCIGLHLARLQIRIAVEEFLKRVESYSVDLDKAVILPSYFHWSYSSLPVKIEKVA